MNDITIQAIGSADVVSASNGSLNVTIPIKMTHRGRRKIVTLPDGTDLKPEPWDSGPTPIQAALARGHRWLAMIVSGKARNLAEIAEAEKSGRSLPQPHHEPHHPGARYRGRHTV